MASLVLYQLQIHRMKRLAQHEMFSTQKNDPPLHCTEHLHNERIRSSYNSWKFTCVCLPGNKPLLVRYSSIEILKFPSADSYVIRNPWREKQEFLLSTHLPISFINFSMKMKVRSEQVSSDRFLSFLPELVCVCRHPRTCLHTHTFRKDISTAQLLKIWAPQCENAITLCHASPAMTSKKNPPKKKHPGKVARKGKCLLETAWKRQFWVSPCWNYSQTPARKSRLSGCSAAQQTWPAFAKLDRSLEKGASLLYSASRWDPSAARSSNPA